MSRFEDVDALTDNSLVYPEERQFAAILGANPSKGARSPVLWNAAFRAHEIAAEMLPLDVAGERLEQLLQVLNDNPLFIGGAIAVPHKEAVARWLGDWVSPEARDIGAVNCLYRHESGHLAGTNTDGEGALRSLESQAGTVKGKRALLLGLGGAGKAVAAFFARAVGSSGRMTVASRSTSGQAFASQVAANWCPWVDLSQLLPNTDLLINCTSVGMGAQVGVTPITPQQVNLLPENAQVFDIIYQPSPSRLLELAAARGLAVFDGGIMNLEQAVLAYGHAAPAPKGVDVTRSVMEQAKRALS